MPEKKKPILICTAVKCCIESDEPWENCEYYTKRIGSVMPHCLKSAGRGMCKSISSIIDANDVMAMGKER